MTEWEPYVIRECHDGCVHWHVAHHGEDQTCAMSRGEAEELAREYNAQVEAARAATEPAPRAVGGAP